jgi:hypothetical protein
MRIKTWKLFTEDLYIDGKGRLRENKMIEMTK